MHDEVRVVAGECTATFDDGTEREHRGDVLAVIKPDFMRPEVAIQWSQRPQR